MKYQRIIYIFVFVTTVSAVSNYKCKALAGTYGLPCISTNYASGGPGSLINYWIWNVPNDVGIFC